MKNLHSYVIVTVILTCLFLPSFSTDAHIQDAETMKFMDSARITTPEKEDATNQRPDAEDAQRVLTKGRRTISCGSVIGTMNTSQIRSVLTILVNGILPSDISPLVQDRIAKKMKYPIQARKICAKCSTFRDLNLEGNSFDDYCGQRAYGNNVTVSGLLLLPMDRDGMILGGSLKGAIWHRVQHADSLHVPSETFPEDGDLGSHMITILNNFDLLGGIASASAGMVSILPDGFGYGRSYNDLHKGYLVKQTYQTSTIPLWLHTQYILIHETKCNTTLLNSALVSGYSEGAYAAVSTASALSSLGVDIIAAQAGGGPYKLASVHITDIVHKIDTGVFPLTLYYTLALLGMAYSSTNSNLPNTNQNQDLLSSEYSSSKRKNQNVMQWFAGVGLTKSQINRLMPDDVSTIFNPDFVAHMRRAIEKNQNPCDIDNQMKETKTLCDAFLQNDLAQIIESAAFPIIFSHSKNDTFSSFENVPQSVINGDRKPNLSIQYISGSHYDAAPICLLNFYHIFTDENFETVLPLERNGICRIKALESTMLFGLLGAGLIVIVLFVFYRLSNRQEYEYVDDDDDDEDIELLGRELS